MTVRELRGTLLRPPFRHLGRLRLALPVGPECTFAAMARSCRLRLGRRAGHPQARKRLLKCAFVAGVDERDLDEHKVGLVVRSGGQVERPVGAAVPFLLVAAQSPRGVASLVREGAR